MNNPGMNPGRRNMTVVAAWLSTGIISSSLVTWPEMWLQPAMGPVIIGSVFGIAAWLLIQVPRTVREIAIERYKHLGVSDDLIENVVIRGQEWAMKIQELGMTVTSSVIQTKLYSIAQHMLDMIADFQHDPNDIRNSRNVLSRVIDQTPKLIQNYRVIEARKDSTFDASMTETVEALDTMIAALETQRVRNNDDNRLALGVDIQVTHDLLRERTPVK